MDPKWIFVAIYLLIDLFYVSQSRPFYEATAKRIQGRNFPPMRIFGVLLAYGAMILAWVYLVLPAWHHYRLISKWNTPFGSWRPTPLLTAAWVGFLYGLLAYGVFNGTNYVMFHDYDRATITRDMIWGISLATFITVAYAQWYVSNQK